MREPIFKGGGRSCRRRPQNKQIHLSQNTDFYKTVSQVADFIFTEAEDL